MEMDRHNARKMLERELREKMEMEDKLKSATAMQKSQLLEYKQKRLKEIEDDILEGEGEYYYLVSKTGESGRG
jgi:hypothetical protein